MIAYGLIVVTGFYFYSIVWNPFIWICTVFVPLFYECVSVFYRNWKINDFRILGDVGKFNHMTLKAN